MLGWVGMLLGWDQTGIKVGTSTVQCQARDWDGMMVCRERTEHERGMGCYSPTPLQQGPKGHLCLGRQGAVGEHLTPRMALV